MKRIVMITGGVETLTYFSGQMAQRFEELGYAVFFYDLKNEERDARKIRRFLRPGETVMLTFNFQGLEKEAGVYQAGVGYIWDTYQIPCYNIVADHPYFYDDRLKELPADYHHISIDRFQQKYFRKYYPEYADGGFLPLAGTKLDREPANEKEYKVLLTGNYTKLSFFEPYINWINEEYAVFYRGIIRDLTEHPWQTVEQAAEVHCEREMGKVPAEDLRMAFHKMIFIDLYVRNYWRGLAVQKLTNAGVTVDVVGKGWEGLPGVDKKYLRIHPQTDSATCLEMIRKSEISLNIMPWFKDGAHDRVFNSIANGAVCVSDTSRYLCDELKEGEGVCYFELTQIEKLPDLVRDLLKDEEKRKAITESGLKKVQEQHLWKHRADTLHAWFCNN